MRYFSTRLCRPAYGGKFCEGSSRSYKLCHTEDCPPNTTDYRAQQCAEFNSKQFRGWYYTWRPYTRVDGETIVPVIFKMAHEKRFEMIKDTFSERLLPTSHVMVVNVLLVASGPYPYFLSSQIKMYVSCTALLKAMISSLPWPAKLRMGPSAHRTVLMSVLTDCVR